jgi:hypothetical protein
MDRLIGTLVLLLLLAVLLPEIAVAAQGVIPALVVLLVGLIAVRSLE